MKDSDYFSDSTSILNTTGSASFVYESSTPSSGQSSILQRKHPRPPNLHTKKRAPKVVNIFYSNFFNTPVAPNPITTEMASSQYNHSNRRVRCEL